MDDSLRFHSAFCDLQFKKIILICQKMDRTMNLAKYLFNSFLIESSPELKIRKFKKYLSIRLFERHWSLANNIWIVFDVIHCSDSIRNIFSLNWDGFWTIGSTLKMKKKNIHLVCILFQTFQCKRNIYICFINIQCCIIFTILVWIIQFTNFIAIFIKESYHWIQIRWIWSPC